MSDQPTTPEPNDADTPSRCGGRRPSSGSLLAASFPLAVGGICIFLGDPAQVLFGGILTAVAAVVVALGSEANDQGHLSQPGASEAAKKGIESHEN
jgi:hypothetical protein